jgi:hypothetical protein
MKICLVGAELFYAEGRTDSQTDMTKLRVAFRNFANAPTSKEGMLVCSPNSKYLVKVIIKFSLILGL